MGTIPTKEQLIEEFHSIDGNHQTAKIHALLSNISIVAPTLDFDTDLENIRTTLEVWDANFKNESYETLKTLAQPIFDYMESEPHWSFLDICLLSSVIAHAKTLEGAEMLTQKALATMEEKYLEEKKYWSYRFVIQFNMISRIVRARFQPDIPGEEKTDIERLKELMGKYFPYVIQVCKDYDLKLYRHIAGIRQGLFQANYKKVECCLARLKVVLKGQSPIVKRLLGSIMDEIVTYHIFLGIGMTEQQLRYVIGLNIRKRRMRLDISREALAAQLQVGAKYIAGVEQGHKNATGIQLYTIAYILGVDMNYIYYGEQSLTPDFHKRPVDKKLELFLKNLTVNEKEKFLQHGLVMMQGS